jgi:hypothetical protein
MQADTGFECLKSPQTVACEPKGYDASPQSYVSGGPRKTSTA